ncbi:hypothetical protein RY831_17190 [Noviherbaspirillum sp. CPCC 100848]|uniref:Uncharacterized protein n=1 Tax=Noviherbaspirillum album TaxID=3080276 RepID=A0ABU6JB78_9BURK|nr:hypothetical protein [Noviherbaspirillum sp. CPCC 100848]MEC4720904.1 hypothetical protein [Noviherbaspirillum sp. CPCC 100848]
MVHRRLLAGIWITPASKTGSVPETIRKPNILSSIAVNGVELIRQLLLSQVEQALPIMVYPDHGFLCRWSGNEVVLQMEAAQGSRRDRRLGRSDSGKAD